MNWLVLCDANIMKALKILKQYYNYLLPMELILIVIFCIFMILFCCLPFGVGGLIFSIKTRDYKKAGNWEAAQNSSKNARLCLWAGLLGGVAINILLVLSGVVSELAGSM